MIFQAMFAIITPALVTGAFAERIKFSALVVFIVLWVTIVYSPVAHWVWASGGWLGNLGALDFAGGTVVHINSGVAALAAAIIFGRRLGFGREPMEPHNVPLIVLGAALLWFGWFGFNAGSALAADGDSHQRLRRHQHGDGRRRPILGRHVLDIRQEAQRHRRRLRRSGRPRGHHPGRGIRRPMAAILIGLGAGVFCYAAIELLLKFKVDDALSVWGVHGIGGTWGALATGLFVGWGYGGLGDASAALSRSGTS